MPLESILTVGKKNGEMDFAICTTINNLSLEQMQEFRAMIAVAIGTAEDMWRRSRPTDQIAASQDGTVFTW